MDDPIYKVNVELRGRGYMLKRAPNGQAIHIMNVNDGMFLQRTGSITEAVQIINDMEGKTEDDPESWKLKFSRIGRGHTGSRKNRGRR